MVHFFSLLSRGLPYGSTAQFTDLPTDGHLGCFWFGAIAHKTAISIHEQAFVCIHAFISLGRIPGSGRAGSMWICV